MSAEIEVAEDLSKSMADQFKSLGEVFEDGRSLLEEKVVNLDGFRVVVRTNESKHPGRPHCTIEVDGKSANFDIHTGELIVGDIKPYNRTGEKVVQSHRDRLLALWTETRPDDQLLKSDE